MPSKNKRGRLTTVEKRIVKGLLARGYRNQDIQHLINIGRGVTINGARITEVKKNDTQKSAVAEDIDRYLASKNEHDFKTGLNPYDHPRLISARESMIMAVQSFNNPNAKFRARTFAVLANIAWTNAFHEYFEREKVDIWKNGKTLALSKMLKKNECPLEKPEIKNLEALKRIRDLVEHDYWIETEDQFTSIFQACCVNFNDFLSKHFGEATALSKEMGLALQFRGLDFAQATILSETALPAKIATLSAELFDNPSDEIKTSPKYAFQVAYTMTSAAKGAAHIQFLSPESHEGQQIQSVLLKKVPGDKLYPYKPSNVCIKVEKATGKQFLVHQHTLAWKKHKVRPATSSKSPEKTNTKFCYYDKAHGDWLYNDAWVDKLVAEMK